MHDPISWYDTPLASLFGGGTQPAVADGAVERSTRRRVDPYVSGLAKAMAVGAGRIPLIP